MVGKFAWGALPPEVPKSALGRVLESILQETGRQERNKGSRFDFGSHFGFPNSILCMFWGVSAACVFSCVFDFDVSYLFFLFPWFAPCARKGRTSRSHYTNQRISSILQLPPSRRRAPRQAENQRHHVQKHHQKVRKHIECHTLLVPGGVPRNEASRMFSGRLSGRPRGAPGTPSRKLKSINFPPQEAPRMRHMFFFRPLGRPRAAAKWAHMTPRSALRTLILDPPPPLPWSIFHSFSESVFEALTFPWVVPFRVRVRPRSIFWGLRRFNFAS